LVIFFLSLPHQALADIAGMSPTDVMNEILGDLGVNKTELAKNVDVVNSARYKKQAPEVALNFDPANPVVGQKVTVVATPSYFLNDVKNNYFTWFLKTADCSDVSDGKSYHYSKDCDLNNDHKVNIEDEKIRAMRILAGNDFDWQNESYSSDDDNDGYKAIWGGNDQGNKNHYCYVRNITSGLDYKIDCDDHLFPHAPGESTGDSSFGAGEEKFWHTNPHNPDTAATGNSDEANVVGLGENTFSWTYNKGDEVGVVAEGVSVDPTSYKDSSYKTMWATPKPLYGTNTGLEEGTVTDSSSSTANNVDINGSLATGHSVITVVATEIDTEFNSDNTKATITTKITTTTTEYDNLDGTGNAVSVNGPSTETTTETEDISDKIGISKSSDLNDLLYRTFVDPQEGGAAAEAKLDVDLSYTPDSPMNDPSTDGADADQLVVTSAVTNADNPSYLDYQWQVYASNEPNPNDWGDPLLKSQLPDSTETSGIDLTSFQFKLNFTNPKKYLKVKLTVKENSSGNSREGHADVVIPISSSSDKIRVFDTSVSDDLKLSMKDTELCKDGLDATICPVVKDQIVGMKVPDGLTDYSWTIDGDPITYPKCFFDGCDPQKQTNVAYFPVLEDTDYQYTVELTATDIKTGENLDLTKTFQVAEPNVSVSSADLNVTTPVLLGNYIDVDGKQWPDYSDQNFQALSYTPLKLKADFVGGTPSEDNYVWYVDSVPITKDNASTYGYSFDGDNNLVLPGKATGDSYDIGVEALYAPDNITKKALNTYWGVSYGEFDEQDISSFINIDLGNSIDGQTSADSGKHKILASVISSTPAYLAFLFRIVLTAFILLISARFIFHFFPNIKKYEE
jgi:hypothetical protein